MDKLSLALVAFSVFTHAWWNFLTKRAGDKHVFTMLTKWAEVIIFLVPAIVVGMN